MAIMNVVIFEIACVQSNSYCLQNTCAVNLGKAYLICLLNNGEVDICTLPDVTKLDGKYVASTLRRECMILLFSYVGVQC